MVSRKNHHPIGSLSDIKEDEQSPEVERSFDQLFDLLFL